MQIILFILRGNNTTDGRRTLRVLAGSPDGASPVGSASVLLPQKFHPEIFQQHLYTLFENICIGDIMSIVGFGFTRMEVTKKEGASGKVNISNNVTVKSVTEKDLSLGKSKENGLVFTFAFMSKYDPDIGSIILEGELIALEDNKKAKEILAEWKKNKKIPKEAMADVLNTVLAKCNIKALILSQEVNLPPPIPLPRIQSGPGTDDKGYIG